MKPIKFIHITKNAGTSIENAGKKKGLLWGRFDKEYGYWHELFCRVPVPVIRRNDWFMVVRNPYTRILSEYHCRWGGPRIRHTKEEMNRFLIAKIKAAQTRVKGDHYTPQCRYTHPAVAIHILKFENLQVEFDALMALYGIKGLVLSRDNATVKRFAISDFSPELIALINAVYHKDFELFGYSKIV